MMFLANAFSLQMLSGDATLAVTCLRAEEAAKLVKEQECISCVGHADTAAVFGQQLGVEVPMNRISLRVESGDQLLVGQLVGGRLPEGATTLPEGFSIRWMLVTIQ